MLLASGLVLEPDRPEQWQPLQAAVASKTELGPSTRVNMEQGESPSPPLTPSRRSVSLRGSPVEKKAFLHPNRSRQRSPSVLSGSSSEQQPAKSEEPVSPVAKSTRLKEGDAGGDRLAGGGAVLGWPGNSDWWLPG